MLKRTQFLGFTNALNMSRDFRVVSGIPKLWNWPASQKHNSIINDIHWLLMGNTRYCTYTFTYTSADHIHSGCIRWLITYYYCRIVLGVSNIRSTPSSYRVILLRRAAIWLTRKRLTLRITSKRWNKNCVARDRVTRGRRKKKLNGSTNMNIWI